MLKFQWQNEDKNICCCFFKCLLNLRAHALQLELNKVNISNFVKFQQQSISFKIKRAFEKTTKVSIKIRLKRILSSQIKRTINQCKISYMTIFNTFFCKNVLLYTINSISMVLEIITCKYSCILKFRSRNTFPEPQPDSASY